MTHAWFRCLKLLHEEPVSNVAFECNLSPYFKVVKAAEADAESKYLAGTGIARQRQAIVNGRVVQLDPGLTVAS